MGFPFKDVLLSCFLLSLTFTGEADARELTVAVASNFTGPMKVIATAFTGETGIKVKPVFASTGKLYAMIQNGGPFDLFMAADTTRPELLYQDNFAQKPFVYAKGKTVLWSNLHELCSAPTWQAALAQHSSGKIVLANPELAPYGNAAMQAISQSSVPGLKDRLVYSQNVAQAFSLAHKVTGLGFTAASMLNSKQGKQGCYWPVPEAQSVEQAACILTQSGNIKKTEAFADFLTSQESKRILASAGYSD